MRSEGCNAHIHDASASQAERQNDDTRYRRWWERCAERPEASSVFELLYEAEELEEEPGTGPYVVDVHPWIPDYQVDERY